MTAPARKTTASKVTDVATQVDVEALYEKSMQIRQAPAWRPTPGTRIRATVIGLRMGDSEYGKYPIIVYKTHSTNEVVALHAFHTILRERLAELQTDIGADHFITYLGTRPSGSRVDSKGDPVNYHNYDADTYENVMKLAESGNIGKDEDFAF
jgi:hypothetical protein